MLRNFLEDFEEISKIVEEFTEKYYPVMKKQVKDLKPGDRVYLLSTLILHASTARVVSVGKEDRVKITFEEKDEFDPFEVYYNYGYASEDDTKFYKELEDLDYDSFGGAILKDHVEKLVFLNKEDLISWVEDEISEIKKNLEELP